MKRIVSLLLCMIFVLCITPPAFANESTQSETAENETIDIFVWTSDLSQGARILEKNVKKVTVAKENAPANVILDVEKLIYNYAARNLYAGEYASLDQISVNSLPITNYDVLIQPIVASNDDYLFVTDYVIPNTGDDLTYFLQEIINKNPNRTIYFPDGVYLISSPLLTSAVCKESVSIQLSDGAVIKATSRWRNRGGNAMICLGAAGDMNNIKDIGSYYLVSGGTLDGSGMANGISINSGREIVVRNICIKNPVKGIIIEYGANNGSADCDFEDVTILGSGMPGTVGIENHAHDNTYTNVRIYDMAKGFINNQGGEIANIYVTFTEKSAKIREEKVGIYSRGRISHCVTVNCDNAFETNGSVIIFDCIAMWTSNNKKQNAFFTKSPLVLSGCKAYFCEGDGVKTKFIEGSDIIEGCFANN